MRKRLMLGVVTLLTSVAWSGPGSGDIFREYIWAGPWVNGSRWQRVTGPEAKPDRAKAHLPNPVNTITLDDLSGARKVEVVIEMLLCHGGTIEKKIRVNDHAWITIPEPAAIPGERGSGPPDTEYQTMRYPCIEIPLDQVRQGENRFAFTCSGGTDLGGWWPQWICYGVTFRVYYHESKPHRHGFIASPRSGAVLGDNPVITCTVAQDHAVRQVDIVGLYEDFNWEGDGIYRQWHGRPFYGKLQNHVGTATTAPWQAVWDTSWIPVQEKPVALMARLMDKTGLCTMTPVVEGLSMARRQTVRMSKPYKVPRRWSTRAGHMHYCLVDVHDDLSKAIAAQMMLCTWNGHGADVIGINAHKLVENVGRDHDLSYDRIPVPVDILKAQANTPFTYSDTLHHGIEVNWPGMVLLVKYDIPETDAGKSHVQTVTH
jgi:hypothetical protein